MKEMNEEYSSFKNETYEDGGNMTERALIGTTNTPKEN